MFGVLGSLSQRRDRASKQMNVVTPPQPATKLTPPGTTGYVWTQTGADTQAFAAGGGGGYSGPINSIPVGDGAASTVNSGATIDPLSGDMVLPGILTVESAGPPTYQNGITSHSGGQLAIGGDNGYCAIVNHNGSQVVLQLFGSSGAPATIQFYTGGTNTISTLSANLNISPASGDLIVGCPIALGGNFFNLSSSASIQATAGDVLLTGTSYTFGCPVLPGPIDTTTIPGTAAGELVTDSADHKLYRWTGAAWLLIG